jgi:ring-1,2-phenylacetyl-CoA epoxidase subunit PaaC
MNEALFEYSLRLGDDMLVLGHRLSEWCGHAPIIEEDIALTNIALDCIGQANALLTLAGQVEGRGRTADDLAYFRDAMDFRNCLLVEQPNGDFAMTIARQFLFDAYSYPLYESLRQSRHAELAAIATKAVKEIRYRLRHCSEWVRRLGDGTEESHRRIQHAFEELWPFTDELFEGEHAGLRPSWDKTVEEVLTSATLRRPKVEPFKRARHTEHLGRMLAEMQSLARAFPGAQW